MKVKTNTKLFLRVLFLAAALSMLTFTGKETYAATITLKASKNKSYKAKAGKNYYAKFKASKTGYVNILTTNTKYITLVNSKHKKTGSCQEGNIEMVIPTKESKATGYAHTASFGVKKGKTYYLKLTANFTDKANVKYKINNCRVYAAKEKANAYKLTKDKKLINAVISGKKKTWWFKYNTTTDYRNLTLEFNTSHHVDSLINSKADPSDYIVEMYNADGELIDSQTINYNGYLYDYHFTGPAGVKGSDIYIKVTAGSKYNSGWFDLKITDKETT